MLALRELLFLLALVAPLVDLYFADVERLGEFSLLLDRPLRVLLIGSLKNADLYLPEAVTMLYGALLAAEVYDDFLLLVCLLGLLSSLRFLVRIFKAHLLLCAFFWSTFDSWICRRSFASQSYDLRLLLRRDLFFCLKAWRRDLG